MLDTMYLDNLIYGLISKEYSINTFIEQLDTEDTSFSEFLKKTRIITILPLNILYDLCMNHVTGLDTQTGRFVVAELLRVLENPERIATLNKDFQLTRNMVVKLLNLTTPSSSVSQEPDTITIEDGVHQVLSWFITTPYYVDQEMSDFLILLNRSYSCFVDVVKPLIWAYYRDVRDTTKSIEFLINHGYELNLTSYNHRLPVTLLPDLINKISDPNLAYPFTTGILGDTDIIYLPPLQWLIEFYLTEVYRNSHIFVFFGDDSETSVVKIVTMMVKQLLDKGAATIYEYSSGVVDIGDMIVNIGLPVNPATVELINLIQGVNVYSPVSSESVFDPDPELD